MRRIDRETVQKILDAADIVEVVSDFVQLKRRGANYIGLCPFHNERTPSFSVSKSKGICKCFSCGKGGSPVNFLMELEQMTFNEALRYLAKKYNIEIKEHELSEKEQEAEATRESMMAINEYAMNHFCHNLTDTQQGRSVGLSYFRERGINDAMIERFRLGYSMEARSELHDAAVKDGYNEKFLLETGLCYSTEKGVIDRFRGRVMYPVFTISGKVVAFGGRTLRKDKDVAKYVNSPESVIYKKSNELYGLYQAKQAIVKKERCILVEGYMDVISMHQSGIENVVASSGTSLTEGQIRLIHRFTENVTVIYDSDAAGIKASLRGIDMLLAEGLNVKVVLFPEGDDPDSFAQSHSSTEVEDYLREHEEDFIAFKTQILLKDAKNDPIERSRVISSIVKSISVIPDLITRQVYVSECSRVLGIEEKVLNLQVARFTADRADQENRERERERNRREAGLDDNTVTYAAAVVKENENSGTQSTGEAWRRKYLFPYESDLIRLVVRYGQMRVLDCYYEGQEEPVSMSVLEYVKHELDADGIEFANPEFGQVFDAAQRAVNEGWAQYEQSGLATIESERTRLFNEGIRQIGNSAEDVSAMETAENDLKNRVEEQCREMYDDLCMGFLAKVLVSDENSEVRRVATDLVVQKHQLSKMHTKYAKVEKESDRLIDLVPGAIYNLKEALIECEIREVNGSIKEAYANNPDDMERIKELMGRLHDLNELKKELSKLLGARVVIPRMRR